MSQAIPVRRTGGQARRPKRTKRRSAGLSPLRGGAALVMVVAVLAAYGVTASSAFAFRKLVIDDGAPHRVVTDDLVGAQLGLAAGSSNLFLLASDSLRAAVEQLPGVLSAEVAVNLPDTVRVRLVERDPILAWSVGDHRFLVDRDGALFADVQPGPGSVVNSLPSVVDNRASAAALAVGGHLDAVDLDAATRLGALRPDQVGSAAAGLRLTLDDEDGFTMRPSSGPWAAVFGFYTPTLRPPDMIPGQVQALRSLLLAQGEAAVRHVTLASAQGGTYLPRATPNASASVSPSAVP